MISAPADRLGSAFARARQDGLPGLMPYVTAGYPRLGDTVPVLQAAERAGCVAAEVGIPFSDPLADGPTVQRTGEAALRNGMTPRMTIEQVGEARARGVGMAIAVMTYVNPVIAYGIERFAADAAAAGADALILPDLPAGEAGPVGDAARRSGLALVPLVAPTTTPERIALACSTASGFVYCVGVTGTTGARGVIAPEALGLLAAVRAATELPRALGFGLSRREHLAALAGRAEGAVVGSALLDAIGAEPGDPAGAAERFLLGMRVPAGNGAP